MTWVADRVKHEAMNEHGYRITWAENKRGTWFNAYSPLGTHVDGGYDKEIVKAMCDVHRERLEKQRAMRAAEKAAQEIHVEQTP
jgi:hypothetical protein